MEGLHDGQLDLKAGSAHDTLEAFPDWKGARLGVALAQKMHWFFVLRSDLGAKRGDVHAVKGLRLGAAPGPDQGLRRFLAEAGIDLKAEKVQIMPIPGATGSGMSFGISAAKAIEEGKVDGFWANGMGCEIAVRRGIGTMVLDGRRGDGPPNAQYYSFPALLTSEQKLEQDPGSVAAAVRAVVKAQQTLRSNPERATEAGRWLFPPVEADLIAELVRRDSPFCEPAISDDMVTKMNRFAQDVGLLSSTVPYDRVVDTSFSHLWTT